MARGRANSGWFWIFLIALLVSIGYGVAAYPHIDECKNSPQRTWNWIPPRFECGYRG